jgi:hypothetical protein
VALFHFAATSCDPRHQPLTPTDSQQSGKTRNWRGKSHGGPMSSRSRKQAIVERASAVPEIASEIAEALHRVADTFETFGCIMAYCAAADMAETAGEQRQLAAVMFATAKQRFGGVKYDGQPITEANIDELDAMWCRFFKVDPKKLPKR